MAKSAGPRSTAVVGAPALRVAGLFAGIGGIELGLHRAGHETKLLCELDAGANAVLADRFPGVDRVSDVTRLAALPRDIELLTAGFPCQDLSQAGKTKGIAGRNSGLVTHVFRLLEKRRVPWLLLENVSFMLRLDRGQAMAFVIAEIERLGYSWAYRVVDSRAFGLPQRRQRVYLVACLPDVGDPRRVLLAEDAGEPDPYPSHRGFANGFYWTEGIRGLGWAINAIPTLKGGSTIGIASPPAIWMPNGDIVKPDVRDGERLQGFPADWTESALQVIKPGARWKLVGNAVTVDAAEWVGRRLATPSDYDSSFDVELGARESWPNAAWSLGDGRRYRSDASLWPMHAPIPRLDTFLKFPTSPLSERGTAGFLSRTEVSSLRFPVGFIDALRDHLARIRSSELATA